MRTECPAAATLSSFACGDLPPDEQASVSEHLSTCDRCTARLHAVEVQTPSTGWLVAELERIPASAIPLSDVEFQQAVQQLLTEPPTPSPALGTMLDDYRLVERLGEGGMGVVFRAVHTRLDKDVAIKIIRPGRRIDGQMIERFVREMKATGKVRHPHLIHATDAGEANGVHYLVMEYVPGVNLADKVQRDGPLLAPQALEYIRQAALGLHHAHTHGLIHRDVKPSNLLLGHDGQVRVLDLGLALRPGDTPIAVTVVNAGPSDDTLTAPEQQLGTRFYAAPEQLRDSHHVDARADVYGLGCTLHYLLTGKHYTREHAHPPALSMPQWKQLLAEDPAARFPSAMAVVQALRSPRRRRLRFIGLGVVVLPVLVAVTLWPRSRKEATPPSTPAKPVVQALPQGQLPMDEATAKQLHADTATALTQPIVATNRLGMDMVLIPRGEFSRNAGHIVELRQPFRIGRTEVTFGQYAQFVEATGYQTLAERQKLGASFRSWKPLGAFPQAKQPFHRLNPGWGVYDPEQPIAFVNIDDIEAFLTWLSAREGGTYRLPTQAEWEWACRAGSPKTQYWSGHVVLHRQYEWTSGNADRPQRVGQLLPNAWGLHDMLGNVEEMVRDYFVIGYTPPGREVNPTGPPKPAGPERLHNRVTCGLSYCNELDLRFERLPGSAALHSVVYSYQGFRVVCDVGEGGK